MKFSVQSSLKRKPHTLIVPLRSGEGLSAALAAVAKDTGLNNSLLQEDFKGEVGEVLSLYDQKQERFFLLGLGDDPRFQDWLKAFRSFAHKNRKRLPPELGISFLHENPPGEPEHWVEASVNGLALATYRLGRFKTEEEKLHPLAKEQAHLHILIREAQHGPAVAAATRGLEIARAQMGIYDLVNAPSNKKVPEDLADWARASGKQHGYSVRVFDKKKIEKTGLHALLAVNQGSAHPPVFLIMEYKPEKVGKKKLKKVGLAGKGVTFDTGGLSIKPSTNMHLMKSDMGGAGAVLGTMEAAARLQLPIHLIGIVPATDNSVDARSVKPSDVIDSYSGKTIEIIDTDAEGRLILADALSYLIRKFEPEVLIDLATLTGSTVRTFGYHAAGLFTNNERLAARLVQSGDRTGERLWRLPLWDIYKEDLKSDVADVRNFSGRPIAGAIGAAKFLEFFTEDHPAWAHLDIAGVAFRDSEFASQRSATAYGIRLLIDLLENLDEK